MTQGWFKEVLKSLQVQKCKYISGLFQVFHVVVRIFQGCLRKFQVCLNKIQRVFRGDFKRVSKKF